MVLEYLASGSLQRHVASTYRVSKQHFGKILDEVCNAITITMSDQFENNLSIENLISSANLCNSKWNSPNCIGSIDGKHVAIKCPKISGSSFFNYKV